MSGHSKWSKIKRKKGVNDAKRGAAFSKIIRKITIAARDGGGDPDTNVTLRLAVDSAKSINMPQDNIDRAIKKGTGELGDGGTIEEVLYEAVFPGNVGCIIQCSTDNKNRTVSEVRKTVEELGGNIGSPGSVSWQFASKGLVSIFLRKVKPSEQYGKENVIEEVDQGEAILELLEVEGIEDINPVSLLDEDREVDGLMIICDKNSLSKVAKAIEELKYDIEGVELGFLPENPLEADSELISRIEKINTGLDNLDDVDKVWFNIPILA